MQLYRTHNCDELNKDHIGQKVKISGWVNSKRDHGNLLFLDIRDHYGIVQAVIQTGESGDNTNINQFARIKLESVVIIEGVVVKRSDDTINKNISTGEIEVVIDKLEINSAAKQIPFQIAGEDNYSEDLRLRYRFLDLRRNQMQKNIILRSKVISYLRSQMENIGFLEIQTPILTASSPEGARDFLVASRIHPGKFYALPQAPQQFKQLLMTSGFDKYFQIAPCFRDEDARADRSPGEFYQLDMEMSFVTQEEIFEVMEKVLISTFEKFGNKKIDHNNGRFVQITYHDAIRKYGTDKPDLRIDIELSDVTESFKGSEFKIFANNIEKGANVFAIKAPNVADKPRKFFDDMISYAISEGAGGLAYIVFLEDGTVKSPIAKFLDENRIAKIKELADINPGDAVFFACDKEKKAASIAGKVRVKIGEICNLIQDDIFKFCWITDFPYYELDEETGKIDFSHNPFSMPQGEMDALINQDPLDIKAYQYDIVCNGVELSSGAIRNHKPEIMYKAFEIAGYSKSEVEKEFAGMVNAFSYGAPPHGGIAPGVDRMVMLLAQTDNIREVIAFPMNGQAQDLLMNAPNYVDDKQLRELNIMLSQKAIKIKNKDSE